MKRRRRRIWRSSSRNPSYLSKTNCKKGLVVWNSGPLTTMLWQLMKKAHSYWCIRKIIARIERSLFNSMTLKDKSCVADLMTWRSTFYLSSATTNKRTILKDACIKLWHWTSTKSGRKELPTGWSNWEPKRRSTNSSEKLRLTKWIPQSSISKEKIWKIMNKLMTIGLNPECIEPNKKFINRVVSTTIRDSSWK